MKKKLVLLAAIAMFIFAQAVIVSAGACGPKVTYNWPYKGDSDPGSTVTFTGSGETNNYLLNAGKSSSPFANNNAINIVDFGEGITSVGDYFFYSTYKLITAKLPSTIERIGKYAFYDTAIYEVNVTNKLKYIDEGAFMSTSIKSFNIPSGVDTISAKAFMNCSYLTDVTIADGVKHIGDYAFANSMMEKITIPSSVESIGSGSFADCLRLKEVRFEASTCEIPDEPGVFAKGATLVGSIGSNAREYAKKYKYVYKSLDGGVVEDYSKEEATTVAPTTKAPEVTEAPTEEETELAKPKKATISSVKNSAKKTAKVSIKKLAGIKKYEVSYSTSKKFTSAKSKTVTTLTATIKSLKKGKTYYFRVRAINAAGKGPWSATKSVKIKK